MKICPKCNVEHNKPGIFCSRACANSRNSSEETNKKRSESNKKASAKFTDTELQGIYAKRLATYRKTVSENICKQCNMSLKKNKHGLCWDCYVQSDIFTLARGHHYKNYKKITVTDSNNESVLLMSSMEIKYYNYLTKNLIKWAKPPTLRYVDDTGKKHWYRPDFLLIDSNEIIEIKGYWWNNDKIKMQWVINQNPDIQIKIIMKDELDKLCGIGVTDNSTDFDSVVPGLNPGSRANDK